MEDTARKRTYAELQSLTETQREQIERYEKRLRDVVAAYKALQKEKQALDDVVKALSSTAEEKKASESDEATDSKPTQNGEGSNEQTSPKQQEDAGTATGEPPTEQNSSEKVEAVSKGDGTTKLREKVAALSNALATVTAEKSRLEQAYVAEKKLLRNEFDEKIGSMQQAIDELEDENASIKQENAELKNKLRSSAHDYETMQMKANREVQELHSTAQRARREIADYETRLNDANAANDKMKQRVNELETQVRTLEAQLRNVNLELERFRLSSEKEEARQRQNEVHTDRIKELESSVASLRDRLQRETSNGSDAKTRLERELNDVRRTYEERLRAFETHVAELSATVGRYETVRRDDELAIEQLRSRCAALSGEKADLLALLDSTNSSGGRANTDMLLRRKRNSSSVFERSVSDASDGKPIEESPLVEWLTDVTKQLERTAVDRSNAASDSIKSHFASAIGGTFSFDFNAFTDSDDFDALINTTLKVIALSFESNQQTNSELVRQFVKAICCVLIIEYSVLSASQFAESLDRTRCGVGVSCSLHSLVHAACLEHMERVRDEFEKYRLRAQAALRSSGSLVVLGGTSAASQSLTSASRLVSSSQSASTAAAGLNASLVNELHSKLTAEREKHAQLEAELANMREFAAKTTQLLKDQHANELRAAESKHRSAIQSIESELQKSRSRTVQLLSEKDEEISLLQKRLDHALTLASSSSSNSNRQQLPLQVGNPFASQSALSSASGSSMPFGTASEPASFGSAGTDRSSPGSPDAASCIDEIGATPFASASAPFNNLLMGRATGSAAMNIVVNEQHARLESELMEAKRSRVALEKELKRVGLEYRNESQRNRELIGELRERIAQFERERGAQSGSNGSNSASGQDGNQYLKNVVYRYLLTDDLGTKKQIANALCMILRFSKQERRTIDYFLREGRLPAGGS